MIRSKYIYVKDAKVKCRTTHCFFTSPIDKLTIALFLSLFSNPVVAFAFQHDNSHYETKDEVSYHKIINTVDPLSTPKPKFFYTRKRPVANNFHSRSRFQNKRRIPKAKNVSAVLALPTHSELLINQWSNNFRREMLMQVKSDKIITRQYHLQNVYQHKTANDIVHNVNPIKIDAKTFDSHSDNSTTLRTALFNNPTPRISQINFPDRLVEKLVTGISKLFNKLNYKESVNDITVTVYIFINQKYGECDIWAA